MIDMASEFWVLGDNKEIAGFNLIGKANSNKQQSV